MTVDRFEVHLCYCSYHNYLLRLRPFLVNKRATAKRREHNIPNLIGDKLLKLVLDPPVHAFLELNKIIVHEGAPAIVFSFSCVERRSLDLSEGKYFAIRKRYVAAVHEFFVSVIPTRIHPEQADALVFAVDRGCLSQRLLVNQISNFIIFHIFSRERVPCLRPAVSASVHVFFLRNHPVHHSTACDIRICHIQHRKRSTKALSELLRYITPVAFANINSSTTTNAILHSLAPLVIVTIRLTKPAIGLCLAY